MCDPIAAYTAVFDALAGHVLPCLHDGLVIFAGLATALLTVIATVRVSAATLRCIRRRKEMSIARVRRLSHKSYSAQFPVG